MKRMLRIITLMSLGILSHSTMQTLVGPSPSSEIEKAIPTKADSITLTDEEKMYEDRWVICYPGLALIVVKHLFPHEALTLEQARARDEWKLLVRDVVHWYVTR